MLNYKNLDDLEFEELCKDILEVQLNTKLRIFAQGRDGGIDLTDSVTTKNIVVQVKHYYNSNFENLYSSLKKEKEKVEKLNPKKYYICCSKELTPDNIKRIYDLFSNYMESDKNIITLKEIDDFLVDESNKSILMKHFKLWITSSSIMSEINNQHIFIDCQMLLSNIEIESLYYVQTQLFNESIKVLEDQKALILLGSPGVGKTITSKMLVMYYANLGYQVRYTTNGKIEDIKRTISLSPEINEIILLDDSLGQCYFNLTETTENELVSLIRYIKYNSNKKIILNSRVTIFNEAKNRSENFSNMIDKKELKIKIIDMDQITTKEKAQIFYNHLIYNKVPDKYYQSVRANRQYLNIVNHRNYNPRIIEYITLESRYFQIAPEDYYDYILECLNSPKDIWKNEFERRLMPLDRTFMNILFSLTETYINKEILEECFISRISHWPSIDSTINHFEDALMRLSTSLVKIIDVNGVNMIGVLNPSINDYLKNVFYDNSIELSQIKKSSIYLNQFERCYGDDCHELLLRIAYNGTLSDIKTVIKENIFLLIAYFITEYDICNENYKSILFEAINKMPEDCIVGTYRIHKYHIVSKLIQTPLSNYYSIDSNINSRIDFLESLLTNLSLEEVIDTSNLIYSQLSRNYSNGIVSFEYINNAKCSFTELISDAIQEYIYYYDFEQFYDSLDIYDVIRRYASDEYGVEMAGAVTYIEELLIEEIGEKAYKLFAVLNEDIRTLIDFHSFDYDTDRGEIESIINSYFEHDYDDFEDRHERSYNNNFDEVDYILDRKL